MTGPEHYRQAEALLAAARDGHRGTPSDQSILAEAQVHATLALAASTATLDAVEGPNGGSATGRISDDEREWAEVLYGTGEPT